MVYYVPQPYTCPKCNFEMEYSCDHHPYGTPILDKGPICPSCWGKWLEDNFPIMTNNKLKEKQNEITIY